jgi:hypothetical protein
MAEVMNKYGRGKIYKICGGDECYIGSTVEPYLSSRLNGHRQSYKRWLDGKTNFITSFNLFEKYGVENCKIELIENYPCDDVNQLNAREGYWIRQGCVNKKIAGQSYKEYCKDNAEEIKENKAKYNKEHAKEIRERQLIYDKKHAEEIKKKRSEKVVCDCGEEIRKDCLSRHQKSKSHLKLIT